MRAALRLLAGVAVAVARPAVAETLITSLSTARVLVTSNYTGSSVVLFGAIERDESTVPRAGDYDVVVTVRGPRQTLTVREKEQIGPIWINNEQQKFGEAPAYLGVFSSRPLDEIAGEALRSQLRIGLKAIVNAPDIAKAKGPEDDPFRDALLRLRAREGLYGQDETGVAFLSSTIFRAAVPVPATAPLGNYDVEVALFADRALITRASTRFQLVKTGFEQFMAELARDWSALYGLATAGVALLFGWLANVVFRRD